MYFIWILSSENWDVVEWMALIINSTVGCVIYSSGRAVRSTRLLHRPCPDYYSYAENLTFLFFKFLFVFLFICNLRGYIILRIILFFLRFLFFIWGGGCCTDLVSFLIFVRFHSFCFLFLFSFILSFFFLSCVLHFFFFFKLFFCS